MFIRSAFSFDTKPAYEIYKKYVADNLVYTYTLEDFENLAARNCLWIAVENDTVDGFAGIVVALDCVAWVYIDILFVLPKYRHKNIARQLLRAVRYHHLDKSLQCCYDGDNHELRSWLDHNGFKTICKKEKRYIWMYKED